MYGTSEADDTFTTVADTTLSAVQQAEEGLAHHPPTTCLETTLLASNSKQASPNIKESITSCNETTGPRVGINLTLAQANVITIRHFSCECISLSYVDRGYNNRTYIAKLNNTIARRIGSSALIPEEIIIRLSGRFWQRWKTEREVATICYLKHKCKNLIPVPTIFGFCSNAELSGINAEYILMETLPGVPLEQIWYSKKTPTGTTVASLTETRDLSSNEDLGLGTIKLTMEDKEAILDQLVSILAQLQLLTFDKIGSFQLRPELGDTFGLGLCSSISSSNDLCDLITLEDIQIGQHTDIMAGPFNTYMEYELAAINSMVEDLKKSKFMSSSLDLIPKIEKFIEKFPTILANKEVTGQQEQDPPRICLVHGDFEPRNIMINPYTLKITGILDWEFAGAFPFYEDWFAGFEFVGTNVNEVWAFGDEEFVKDHELEETLEEDEVEDDEYNPNSEELTTNREIFFKCLDKFKLPNPIEIPNMNFYADLWHFKWHISPWWLDELLEEADMAKNEVKFEKDKAYARKIVLKVLDKYEID